MLPLVDKLPGAYVSTNAYGEVLRPSTALGWFRDTAEAAGMPGVTSHELRKFYVTTNLAAGVNPATVAKNIGETVKVMLDTYSLSPASDADVSRAAVSGALAAAFAA
jgi:integrase